MSAKNKQVSKAAQARELSVSDIQLEISKSRQELLDLRLKKTTGQLDNPLRIRALRRNVARLATIANEKRTSAAKV